jgi:hypothetical protein
MQPGRFITISAPDGEKKGKFLNRLHELDEAQSIYETRA